MIEVAARRPEAIAYTADHRPPVAGGEDSLGVSKLQCHDHVTSPVRASWLSVPVPTAIMTPASLRGGSCRFAVHRSSRRVGKTVVVVVVMIGRQDTCFRYLLYFHYGACSKFDALLGFAQHRFEYHSGDNAFRALT